MQEKKKIDGFTEELLNNKELEEPLLGINGEAEEMRNKKLHEVLMRINTSPDILQYAESVRDVILDQLNHRINRSVVYLQWWKISVAVAVIFLLFGATGYLCYNIGYRQQNSQLVTVKNPLGIQTTLTLPDSSIVTLNAGSAITYPTAFISKERKIVVEGEGYFEIKHDPDHPFVVSTEDIHIKVLGTKFNVKAYKDEKDVEVTLSEGKVCIGLKEELPYIIMNPHQQVCFDKVKRLFSKRVVNLNNYIAWKEGKFYFNAVTFQNIARQLERKFNVHIYIASKKLQNTVFTGDFIRGENLEQILRVMTMDKRIKYEIDGDQIYIREK